MIDFDRYPPGVRRKLAELDAATESQAAFETRVSEHIDQSVETDAEWLRELIEDWLCALPVREQMRLVELARDHGFEWADELLQQIRKDAEWHVERMMEPWDGV